MSLAAAEAIDRLRDELVGVYSTVRAAFERWDGDGNGNVVGGRVAGEPGDDPAQGEEGEGEEAHGEQEEEAALERGGARAAARATMVAERSGRPLQVG